MNQRPQGLQVSKAMTGFLQYKQAEGLSPATVFNYERDLKLRLKYLGDMDVGLITSTHLLNFVNYLRIEYVPRRIVGDNDRKLSDKTIYNFYMSLSSFFTWARREFEIPNPMKKVPRQRVPEDPPVEPFKREEIELLLKACDSCAEAETHDRRKFVMHRPTGKLDKAILLTLLDTGLRASELCALRIGDIDLRTGKIIVRSGAGRAGFPMPCRSSAALLLPIFAPAIALLNMIGHLLPGKDAGDHGFSMLALEVTRALSHNVTTEMDLILWETALAIQSHQNQQCREEEYYSG